MVTEITCSARIARGAACVLLPLQVHSSLEAVDRSDFNFPVTFNGMDHTVYVRQRPHLHDFMVRGACGGAVGSWERGPCAVAALAMWAAACWVGLQRRPVRLAWAYGVRK